jgi:hypothetical protein
MGHQPKPGSAARPPMMRPSPSHLQQQLVPVAVLVPSSGWLTSWIHYSCVAAGDAAGMKRHWFGIADAPGQVVCWDNTSLHHSVSPSCCSSATHPPGALLRSMPHVLHTLPGVLCRETRAADVRCSDPQQPQQPAWHPHTPAPLPEWRIQACMFECVAHELLVGGMPAGWACQKAIGPSCCSACWCSRTDRSGEPAAV